MVNPQSISYNGVTLTYAQMSYSGRATYDGSGRTLQGHQLMFSGSAWLIGTTPADLAAKIQQFNVAFSHSRKRFIWQCGTQVMWDIGGDGAGAAKMDRRFGPKPMSVSVDRITGGLSAQVRFQIETFVSLCDLTFDYEEFWWKFDYSYDRNYVCTRSISGQYRMAVPINAPLKIFQSTSIWPTLPNGFYRDSIQHSMSPDGQTITFQITDKQVWRTLPRPITNGSATLKIEQQAAKLTKSFSCWFEAPTDVNKQIIVQFITALIKSRFPFLQTGVTTQREYITQFSITNHEFENRVEASISTVTSADSLIVDDTSTILPSLLFGDVADIVPSGTDAWEQSDGSSTKRPITGTAGLVPQPAEPFDVCQQSSISAIIPDENQNGTDFDASIANTAAVTVYNGASTTATSDTHREATYVRYSETYEYMQDHHLQMIPLSLGGNMVQKTRSSTTQILITGHAQRINAAPEPTSLPPQYTISGQATPAIDYYIARQSIRTRAPVLMPDSHHLKYETSWTYVLLVPDDAVLDNTNVGVTMPKNPQLAASVVTKYQQNPLTVLNGADPANSYTPTVITPPVGP